MLRHVECVDSMQHIEDINSGDLSSKFFSLYDIALAWFVLFILHLILAWSCLKHMILDVTRYHCLMLESSKASDADIVARKSICEISGKLTSCVAKWAVDKSEPFTYSTLTSFLGKNRQRGAKCSFDVSNCNDIFDILVHEKTIGVPANRSSNALQKSIYCKWYDFAFSRYLRLQCISSARAIDYR
jgi:hypothetical protein